MARRSWQAGEGRPQAMEREQMLSGGWGQTLILQVGAEWTRELGGLAQGHRLISSRTRPNLASNPP